VQLDSQKQVPLKPIIRKEELNEGVTAVQKQGKKEYSHGSRKVQYHSKNDGF